MQQRQRSAFRPAPANLRWSRIWLYAFAFVITVATVWIDVSLFRWLGAQPLVIVVMIPIIVSAYLGGAGPGLLSTFTGVIGISYFMLPPLHQWSVLGAADNLRWISLLIAGALVSVLCEALHRARRSAEGIGAEQQRLAEEKDAVRRTEHLLRTVSENLNAIIWVKDLEGRYQFINDGFVKQFDRRREEILGKTDFDLFPREQAEIFNRMDRQALAAGQSYQSEETMLRDGEPFSYLLSVKCPLVDESGEVYGLCGMSTDISERKLDEDTLAAERTLLRTLIDSLPDIVFTKDTSGKFTLCNAAELRHTGLAHEVQLIGKNVFDLYPEELARSYHADDLQVIGGTPVLNREEPSLDAAGNRLWFLTIKVPLRNRKDEIVGLLGISRDITERKRAEEAQQRSQKMEALGTLAGGIAHDFNNILLAITGNAKLAMDDLPADHNARASLNEIDKASLRASDLVRRILAFARQQEIRHAAVQMMPVVEEAVRLLRSTLPAMIRIETRFAADLPPVAADASQVHQILLNLGTNAAYAIGEGQGVITISLEALIINDDLARLAPGLQAGRYVRLSMSDDGCGMDKPTLERIFDPFFTTKPVGQGTGLGLSTVHGIMQSHHGALTVYSQPGKGTVFHLYFPSLTEVQAEPAQAPPPLSNASGERLLYVDDERALVDLSTRILGRLGYEVIGFTEPDRALQAFRAHPQDFAAAVTDLSMPGMSGFELSRALLDVRPDLPIVMTSGYVRPEDQETALQIGIRELIPKPNTAHELGRVLNDLLRKSGVRPRDEP